MGRGVCGEDIDFFFFFVSKGGRRMLALSSGLQWLESFENKPACLSKQQIVLSF